MKRADFSKAAVLVFTTNTMTRGIVVQTLEGFGFGQVDLAETVEEAKSLIRQTHYTFLVVDSERDGEEAKALYLWIRGDENQPNQMSPIFLLATHVTKTAFIAVRNFGVDFTLLKPISPEAMMQRIVWLAEHDREFIKAANYTGYDRRVRLEGPPPGSDGRRSDDMDTEISDQISRNLEQDELDDIVKPQRADL